MAVARYTPQWTIPNAGPAFSVFHFRLDDPNGIQAAVNALRGFMNTGLSYCPNDVTVDFPGEVSVHDEDSGKLTGTIAVTAPASLIGGVSGSWAGGAGYRIDWQTNVIYDGRRVRGRTFFVPAGSSVYSTGGQVIQSLRTAVQTSAATYLAAADSAGAPMCVLSRRPNNQGFAADVQSGTVSTLAATLRERKA